VKSGRRVTARPRRGPTLLERSRALITGGDLAFGRVIGDEKRLSSLFIELERTRQRLDAE
jgi:hypothetical protein